MKANRVVHSEQMLGSCPICTTDKTWLGNTVGAGIKPQVAEVTLFLFLRAPRDILRRVTLYSSSGLSSVQGEVSKGQKASLGSKYCLIDIILVQPAKL